MIPKLEINLKKTLRNVWLETCEMYLHQLANPFPRLTASLGSSRDANFKQGKNLSGKLYGKIYLNVRETGVS